LCQGHARAISDAVRDHYKPIGQGDEVPTAPVTVAVSLADKLDTLGSFFLLGELPTGSKDPFALRRSALGVIRLLVESRLRLQLNSVRPELVEGLSFLAGQQEGRASTSSARTEWWDQLSDFFADRLKVQQREAGVRHDLIDAVFALGGEDDLVRLLARVRALQAFVETSEGADLLAGYKRAANILKKEGWWQAQAGGQPSVRPERSRGAESSEAETTSSSGAGLAVPRPGSSTSLGPNGDAVAEHGENKSLSYPPEKEEAALIAALDSAAPRAAAAVEAEDFERAMAALASLRAPVDAFFDKVTVNDPDPDKRAARLDLLARMRDAVRQVADFSRIEG
jgi:glycyl-tRNA synthetase beta chain